MSTRRPNFNNADLEQAYYYKRRSFGNGYTIKFQREALLWASTDGGDGNYYIWGGVLPKVVPAGSTPETAGGVSQTAWINVGSAEFMPVSSYGLTSELAGWKGKRGQWDVWPSLMSPITAAGISFGGDKLRGMVMVNTSGGIVSAMAVSGQPITKFACAPYTVQAGRLDAFGRQVVVTNYPTFANNQDNLSYQSEFQTDVKGQPVITFRTVEKRTSFDNVADSTIGDRAVRVADEFMMLPNELTIGKIRIPTETTPNRLDPAKRYDPHSSLSGTTLHMLLQSRFQYDIISIINSRRFNCYVSMRCTTNANGNDTTKYGLYLLSDNAQFTGDGAGGTGMFFHVPNFTQDPDGKAANAANSPGNTMASPVNNYTDMQFIFSSVPLTPGVNLTDRYNGFTTALQYPWATTKAIQDVVTNFMQYINKQVVTNATLSTDTPPVLSLTKETITMYNPGYVFEFDFDMSIRNGVVTTPQTFVSALGEFSAYDYCVRVFNRFGLKGYNK
ncbi:tail spike protein [Serratia phage vB_SmaA_3M]|uniref:Putative tail spike protein n=1 Tax=Serratia phage vB_SmaA_3M TaxID=2419930 RepID=A0A3G2YS24_9CAUD|nr:tail spike protein [Serratia phage vB_SmaA_3M]AYP28291.1 putative tail spike protein [Serratia phage vB_SmaA_3M]